MQGRSAYEYWNTPDNQITICDQDENLHLPPGVDARLDSDYLHDLARFDLLIRSPRLHPRDIVAVNSPETLKKVTTNTNEFFRVCPSRNIIGVTGTKGKGTTSTLIAKMLGAAGKRVHLGGNIGTPPLDMLKDNIRPDDWVVLELANFQLIDLKYSPKIAVCLMVVPEHLDWHADMEEYIDAKKQLFVYQKSDDIAIFYANNGASKKIAGAGRGQKVPYFAEPGAVVAEGKVQIDGQNVCGVDEVKLLGKHNLENVCAAITTVWQISQDIESIRKVIVNFVGLEHRLEFVREVNAVKFYNDSFAATPDAAIAAMKAISGPKVMIIGGFDRNLPIDHLVEAINNSMDQVAKVVLIGASAGRLAKALAGVGYKNYTSCDKKNMTEIVTAAKAETQAGNSIVLSPGFPSFDMFKNFEERGLKFKEAVNAL